MKNIGCNITWKQNNSTTSIQHMVYQLLLQFRGIFIFVSGYKNSALACDMTYSPLCSSTELLIKFTDGGHCIKKKKMFTAVFEVVCLHQLVLKCLD